MCILLDGENTFSDLESMLKNPFGFFRFQKDSEETDQFFPNNVNNQAVKMRLESAPQSILRDIDIQDFLHFLGNDCVVLIPVVTAIRDKRIQNHPEVYGQLNRFCFVSP